MLFAALVIAAVLLFWGLGNIPLMSLNEARRAVPASNMFAQGDWLLPRLNGELYLTKPPLLYWLTAAVAHLFGTANEWAVRLPSAIAATAVAVVVYRYALRQFGFWPAFFALQVLIANTSFAMFARRAEIEMLLTALCVCALLAALKYTRGNGGYGWLRLSYFLLGAATLTKGPLALLFVTLPLLADALHGRQPRQWEALRDPLSWGIFLLVGSSWYLAVTWHMGFDIWQSIFQKDIVGKMSGSSSDPFYLYLFWLLADFFPASLLLFAAPLATWRRWKAHPETVALLLATLLPLLVYSAFSNKHGKYLLPIYPFIAILLGKRLGEVLHGASPLLRRTLLVASILLPAGYAAFYAVAESRVFDYRFSAFARFTDWLASVEGVPVYGYVDLDERLVFYAKRDIPIVSQASLQTLRSTGTPMLLLVENSRIPEIKPLADCLVNEFTPYLKKGKSLAVYGFGSVCASSPAVVIPPGRP